MSAVTLVRDEQRQCDATPAEAFRLGMPLNDLLSESEAVDPTLVLRLETVRPNAALFDTTIPARWNQTIDR
jgi:hypothetical protein